MHGAGCLTRPEGVGASGGQSLENGGRRDSEAVRVAASHDECAMSRMLLHSRAGSALHGILLYDLDLSTGLITNTKPLWCIEGMVEYLP